MVDEPPDTKEIERRERQWAYFLGYVPSCVYSHKPDDVLLRDAMGEQRNCCCSRCLKTGYHHLVRPVREKPRDGDKKGKIVGIEINPCPYKDFNVSKKSAREMLVMASHNGVADWIYQGLQGILGEMG